MPRAATAAPEPHSDLVLFMLDLDHFKRVNDQHGHAAGDAVLQQTASLLRDCMRSSDHIVRWGVSIGFAAFPGMPGRPSALTPESLQRLADAALCAAKHTWRDAWVGVQARSGEAGLSRFLADPAARWQRATSNCWCPSSAGAWSIGINPG